MGPVAADGVSHGKEGTPVVAEAIDGAGRQGRVTGGDGGQVVLGPTGHLAAQNGFEFGVTFDEAGVGVAFGVFNQRQDEGAGAQGQRQWAEAGQGGGGIDLEFADLVAFTAVGARADSVAAVEQAAHVRIEMDVGVQFVQEQGGLAPVDGAEEDGGFEVVGAQDAWAGGGQDVVDGAFAAAGCGGGEVEARGKTEGADSVGVAAPEGADDVDPGQGIDVVPVTFEDFVEEGGGVGDGLRPGVELGEFDGVGLGVVGEDTAVFDGGVEGSEAEAEAFGFGFADEVVVLGGKQGEAGKGGGAAGVG